MKTFENMIDEMTLSGAGRMGRPPSRGSEFARPGTNLRPWVITIDRRSGNVYDHVGEAVTILNGREADMHLRRLGAKPNDRVVIQRIRPAYWIEVSARDVAEMYDNLDTPWIRGQNRDAIAAVRGESAQTVIGRSGVNRHASEFLA